MTTLRTITAIMALLLCGLSARADPTAPTGTVYTFTVTVDTNGIVTWPTNFWTLAILSNDLASVFAVAAQIAETSVVERAWGTTTFLNASGGDNLYGTLQASGGGGVDYIGTYAGPHFNDSGSIAKLYMNSMDHCPMWIDGATGWAYTSKVWTARSDGSGSGLDADKLDGSHLSDIQAGIVSQSAINASNAADRAYADSLAESVVTGAVCTVASGSRYFWTTATNVILSASLTSGQVVNFALLRNTATNAITATGPAGWLWTGGSMTNSIGAGLGMTFGWACNPIDGATNAYATAESEQ